MEDFSEDDKQQSTGKEIYLGKGWQERMSVTVASAESSFSKLKLIKTFLRTAMTQDRLTHLATISIESELLDTIQQHSIIENVAAARARKVSFETA